MENTPEVIVTIEINLVLEVKKKKPAIAKYIPTNPLPKIK